MILGVCFILSFSTGSAHNINLENQPYVYVQSVKGRLFLPSHIMIQHMLISGDVISIDMAAKLMNALWREDYSKKIRRKGQVGTLPQ